MPLLETKNASRLMLLIEIECVSEANMSYFQPVIPIPLSKLCYEYAFMASIKGEMTSNSWLLRGVLTPELKIRKATQ